MKQKPKEKTGAQKQPVAKPNELEVLRTRIESLQKEKDELFAKLQRISADYANFQKRAPRQVADSVTYEKERIIKALLPALDNFEHTLANARTSESIDVLVKGVRIVYDQMLDILKSHGTEQIKALGEKFDPALHQAMMQKCQPRKKPHIVLEEFQKGYKLNGRVIRPSKVVVNAPPAEQPPDRVEQTEQAPNNKTTDKNKSMDAQ